MVHDDFENFCLDKGDSLLLDDMHETLEKVGGYGCAAVHVGILRRMVVVNDDNGVIELINPTIIESSKETQEVAAQTSSQLRCAMR